MTLDGPVATFTEFESHVHRADVTVLANQAFASSPDVVQRYSTASATVSLLLVHTFPQSSATAEVDSCSELFGARWRFRNRNKLRAPRDSQRMVASTSEAMNLQLHWVLRATFDLRDEPKVRILFLDFDGVLHPSAEYRLIRHLIWVPILARLLERQNDVQVVVHSTWRYDHTDSELKDLLGPLGSRFVGSAPRGPRAQAIESVLSANKGVFTHHLVLDDQADDFAASKLTVLLLDGRVGISDPCAQLSLVEWLLATAPTMDRPA